MGKKKPFIDKKNSSTYHVLHRSQRDVGGDGSGVVLWPSAENNQETNEKVLRSDVSTVELSHWKDQMAQVGLVDDYDYDKHMKEITGTGDFFSNDGHRGNPLNDVRAARVADDIAEVERQLDSIALTADCMDDDIAQALFGDFDEGEYEEILDDFCITAAQEPETEEEEFDFDAHVKALMEKARLKSQDKGIDAQQHEWGREDADFFSKAKALHQNDDDDSGFFDDEPTPSGVVSSLNPDEERALCEKFEQTLLEYDSDEVGDLDEECEEIGGERPLEGDKQIEAALDTYLEERDEGFYMEGKRNFEDQKGSGFLTLPTAMQDEPEDMNRVLKEAQDFLRSPELLLPPEEILIDGKSYFSQSSRNPWDCESVLSTYSNLDNNPAVIDSGRRRGKKKTKKVESVPEDDEQEVAQIKLSNKTGLPLGVLPSKQKGDDFDYDTIASLNKGERRRKDETTDQKRLRKQQVKQERLMARIQKKVMREAFAEEFLKHNVDVASNDIAGKSVFRF